LIFFFYVLYCIKHSFICRPSDFTVNRPFRFHCNRPSDSTVCPSTSTVCPSDSTVCPSDSTVCPPDSTLIAPQIPLMCRINPCGLCIVCCVVGLLVLFNWSARSPPQPEAAISLKQLLAIAIDVAARGGVEVVRYVSCLSQPSASSSC
jgi:hypothetical protein